jgi:hypothetical protein
MGRLLKLGIIAGLGYLWYSRSKPVPVPSAEDDHGPVGSSGIVRNAGPESQSGIKNSDWDQVDEQVDESFPASDPPGSY